MEHAKWIISLFLWHTERHEMSWKRSKQWVAREQYGKEREGYRSTLLYQLLNHRSCDLIFFFQYDNRIDKTKYYIYIYVNEFFLLCLINRNGKEFNNKKKKKNISTQHGFVKNYNWIIPFNLFNTVSPWHLRWLCSEW